MILIAIFARALFLLIYSYAPQTDKRRFDITNTAFIE